MKRNLALHKPEYPSQVNVEICRLNQQLQYLIQVIQQLAVARDLDTIMAIVRTGARQLAGADGATFVLRDGDLCYYADEDAITPLWKGGRFPMSACISGWVMLHQQSVIITDIYADSRIPVDAYRPTFVKSLAMVPIRTRDPIGAIGNYWATHHTPSAETMQLLETLADAAAVALENVYLYEAQERRIQERTAQLQKALAFEALLKRITEKVRDSLDEQQILMTVVQELVQSLGAQGCETTLYHLADRSTARSYRYTQTEGAVIHPGPIVAPGLSSVAHQFLLAQPSSQWTTLQWCHSPPPQAQSETEPTRGIGRSAVLVCPIQDAQRLLGCLTVYRAETETFVDLEVQLVEQVANQCAIALRQAQLHQTTQAQVHELEQLNQLKDDFLSTVSHELRSPMTSIRLAAQMIQSTLGIPLTDSATPTVSTPSKSDFYVSPAQYTKLTNYLQILSGECQREINLINDLLALTQLKTDPTVMVITSIRLDEWLPQLIAPFQERIRHQHQQLQLHLPIQPLTLYTNLPHLERIISELLDNACKYTPSNESIIISAQPTATYQTLPFGISTDSIIQLQITNTGVEIAAIDRAHIFDKFYRIPNDNPWKHRGTGLGLALVKHLVSHLGGEIQVSSSENQVSFLLKLPSRTEAAATLF